MASGCGASPCVQVQGQPLPLYQDEQRMGETEETLLQKDSSQRILSLYHRVFPARGPSPHQAAGLRHHHIGEPPGLRPEAEGGHQRPTGLSPAQREADLGRASVPRHL